MADLLGLSSAGLTLDAPGLIELIHPSDIPEAWIDACTEFDLLYLRGEIVQYDLDREDTLAEIVISCFTRLVHARMRAILNAQGHDRHRLEIDTQCLITTEYEDPRPESPYDFHVILHLRNFIFTPVVRRFDEDRESNCSTVAPHLDVSDDDSP